MGQLIYINNDKTQQISIKISDEATTIDFVEQGVVPLMYAIGYFPTRIAEVLNLEDVLSIYKNYKGEDSEYL